MRQIKINSKLKTLSLFTGAGGLDLGFHKAGFDITECVEIDKRFCNTLKDNKRIFGNLKIINKDVRKIQLKELSKKYDFIIGGPPCQSFSASGKRKGLNDDRGLLFKSFVMLLKHFKPKGFLFENVRGLLYANKGKALKEIKSAFEKCGYNLNVKLINAADYGVPQFRERVFLLGSKKDILHFPFPTHGGDSIDNKKYVSIWDVLKDIYNHKEKEKPFGGKYGHLLPLVPEGENYSFFTSDKGYKKPIFKWRTKFSNFLYKVNRNEPCRTIQAQPGKYSGPFHWKNRKLNTKELKRIQTFPDNYKFNAGSSVCLHQIGNSVAPLLAYNLALAIRYQLLKDIKNVSLIDKNFIFNFEKKKHEKHRATRLITKIFRNKRQLSLFKKVI